MLREFNEIERLEIKKCYDNYFVKMV